MAKGEGKGEEEDIEALIATQLSKLEQQQPALQKPAEQTATDNRPLLEETVSAPEYSLSSHALAEKLTRLVEEAAAKAKTANDQTERRSTADEVRRIGASLGIKLGDYAICQITPPGQSALEPFYTGEVKPLIMASDMPVNVLEQANPETGMCPKHQAVFAISLYIKEAGDDSKAIKGKHASELEALLIEKWEELDSAAAKTRLAELELEGDVAVISYKEVVPKAGNLTNRQRQAVVFPMGKYDSSAKQRILAQLRGQTVEKATEKTAAQKAYATGAAGTPAPQQPPYGQPIQQEPAATAHAAEPSSLEEMLPKGKVEEMKLTTEILFNGKLYEFTLPTLLNELMAIDGQEGCRLEGKSSITFTGRRYISDDAARKANYASAEAARKEAELKLAAKDKRVRAGLSGELRRMLEAALEQTGQNPQHAQEQLLIQRALNYIASQGNS